MRLMSMRCATCSFLHCMSLWLVISGSLSTEAPGNVLVLFDCSGDRGWLYVGGDVELVEVRIDAFNSASGFR